MQHVTLGEIVATIGGIAVLATVVVKVWKPIRAIIRFLDDWNGRPERHDRAGKIIERGRPGFPAQLEAIRAQVENSHTTNLRDDIDELKADLKQHITISKQKDGEQEDTAKKLDEHIEQTDQLMPMLKDLHTKWSPPDHK